MVADSFLCHPFAYPALASAPAGKPSRGLGKCTRYGSELVFRPPLNLSGKVRTDLRRDL